MSPELPQLRPVPAICYSGYREGQSPQTGVHPSRAELREDLRLLARHWRAIRLYDCGPPAETILQLIVEDGLDLSVMLGAYIDAELSNPRCPWGGVYPDEVLARNRAQNEARIEALIELAARYPQVVTTVSAGNEATVEWSDHLVPVDRVVEYVRRLKRGLNQPVTFCENYVPWLGELDPLAREVDFISVHTYPIWEQKGLSRALEYTEQNVAAVMAHNPRKPVVITEAGWTTRSNGRGIPPADADEVQQHAYLEQLTRWSQARGLLTYVFEAFDEPWKGSDDPDEPEKHWGLFSVDRRPKPAVRHLFPDL